MTQSNPDFELTEMPLPPQPPPEDDGVDKNLAYAVNFDGLKEFDSWQEAMDWSLTQRKAGSPKYLVRATHTSADSNTKDWEAIQAWLRML
jgi:hypothetical protein